MQVSNEEEYLGKIVSITEKNAFWNKLEIELGKLSTALGNFSIFHLGLGNFYL